MPDQHTNSSATPIRLRLGTRQSPLAMAQAHETRARLCDKHGWDTQAIALVPVQASGDKIQDRPLADLGGKALWTKELDQWLHSGRIDAAVHSLKDVETVRPDWITIAAVLPRADRRDVLIGAESLAALPPGAMVGTSAPRRAAQLLHSRPDCKVVTMRGNVATRLAKLEAGDVQATFLAAAGLTRLGMDWQQLNRPAAPLECNALDCSDWMPAAGQGAIGMECRTDDAQTMALLAAINDPVSAAQIRAEREFLAGIDGTCHSPVGAVSQVVEEKVILRAALFSSDGQDRIDGTATLAAASPQDARAFGGDLLSRASPSIQHLFAEQ